MHINRRIIAILIALTTFTVTAHCRAESGVAASTPEALYQWKEWVLYDNREALCPTRYDDPNACLCTWPTALALNIEKSGGTFRQEWIVFSETMVPLPGGGATWPMAVTVDGKPAPVVPRGSAGGVAIGVDGDPAGASSGSALPAVSLTPGTHTVAGEFRWDDAPLMLNVPPAVGLVSLTLFGQKVSSPGIDASGLLWLRKETTDKAEADRHEMAVFRLINDTIPLQITTRLQLKVSGAVREIALPGLLFPDTVPVSVQSALPVRVEEDGRVVLQARPGTWDIRITTRSPGPVSELTLEAPLVETEIWSFQAQNQLRMVKLQGASAVDPSQTEMPAEWLGYPAYLLGKGETLSFEEIRRGDPEPSPDKLALQRTLWLDFDGGGFTIRDSITGTLSRSWSLALNPPAQLGRVAVDGQDMLVTGQGPDGKPGVQLRKGSLNLEADLRLGESAGPLSAVGWDHDFQEVWGTLNLPPGWRLFAAGGVDDMPGTWLQEWTLMDIFIVLIIGVALFKLRGWKWGAAALVMLCLTYNEAGAPRTVWLCIIAVMALARALPDGWPRRLTRIGGVVAVVVLLVISIPFMVTQLRCGFFPQLEPVGYSYGYGGMKGAAQVRSMPASDGEFVLEEISVAAQKRLRSSFNLYDTEKEEQAATTVYDPDALVQTGPGVPDWTWRAYNFSWNGPVTPDQTVRFRLISPAGNLVLSILRVFLLALMIFCVINTRGLWAFARSGKLAGSLMTAALLGLLCLPAVSKAAGTEGAFPSEALLQELEKRLLEKHDCYPNCADIPTLEITARGDSLRLLFEVDAAIDTAVPLPVTTASWQPESILLDGEPIPGLSREEGGALWALIPRGVHQLLLSGNIRSRDDIQLPFSLKPHFAAFDGSGWAAVGIGAQGGVGESIRLTRLEGAGPSDTTARFETSTVPAFLEVERIFHLGITWTVTTEFRYRADTDSPVVVSYPLLADEAVTSSGVEVTAGKAVITLAAGRSVTMDSTLGTAPEIQLRAPENVPWTEVWVLDASPIWSCDFSGISPVHHQDTAGQWRPTWNPWPGETVDIAVTRPGAIPGQSVTIDGAALSYTPGQRYHQAELNMHIRTSRGGQHQVQLPENATLQYLSVDGESLPVEQSGQLVSFPIEPGTNDVSIEWRQAAASGLLVRSPDVTIGEQAVNADVTFTMPENRWILMTGGPRLGPAVLFWSYLMVVVLAAFCLKYVTVTPLKFWHWLLLGIGLTQVPAVMALGVVAWFIAFGFRESRYPGDKRFAFNLVQVGLFFLTLLALGCLYSAVRQGLLGTPDMQIAGNDSSRYVLRWTQDRIDAVMPAAWAVVVPMLTYHLLMLLWSLWLAFSLVKWLRWGWRCYGTGGFWKHGEKKRAEVESGD
jgi:hypothetical protein